MSFLDQLRAELQRSREEGRLAKQEAVEQFSGYEKDRACQEIAAWLKEADINAGKCANTDDYYYAQAEQKISGVRWQLYKLNRPFVWLEKKVIEPLDGWSDRANVFQFFSKISPVIEAIGVLAIPFVIIYYENQRQQQEIKFEDLRVEKNIKFERSLISAQAKVRKQQAVRDYLTQIATIYLDAEQKDNIDDDHRKLIRATTLAVLEELSINENSDNENLKTKSDESDEDELIKIVGIDSDFIEGDQKREVIEFLSELGWINSSEGNLPLILLDQCNLSKANLEKVDLKKANLREANLEKANLGGAFLTDADLFRVNLKEANLKEANLRGVNLELAELEKASLEGANLNGAKLEEAKLAGANLNGAKLEGANLNQAFLVQVNFEGANLEQVNIREVNLYKANLKRVNLKKANLEGSYLGRAKLRGANLKRSNLKDADLTGADLYEAILIEANLKGADFEEANLERVIFCDTIMPDGSINNRDCK